MEPRNGLLCVGSQKNLNFPVDGASWKGGLRLAGANASSAIVPPSHGAVLEEKQSTSGLKEHDYIGLAEVSSSVNPIINDSKTKDELTLRETDLSLGLGLGLGHVSAKKADDCVKTEAFPLKHSDGAPQAAKEGTLKAPLETPRYSFPEGAGAFHGQKPWQSPGSLRANPPEPLTSANLSGAREYENPNKLAMFLQDFGEGSSRAGTNTFHGAQLKNGTKRGYTEAMKEASKFSIASGARAGTAVTGKIIEGEVKALPKHQQGAFMSNWAPSKPNASAHWPATHEKSSSYAFAMSNPGIEKPVAEHVPSSYNPSEAMKEPASNEPPPPKGQVVGWPPIRSYRKQNLAKPTEMYVKVNMDGMTVGRKVDLNAHSSYEGLLAALEEMFQPSSNGGQGTSQSVSGRESHPNDPKQLRLRNGSDYLLTYEDQDGDWMLVGDVPWSMFVSMVRRLRITRGSDATGLAPARRPDNAK